MAAHSNLYLLLSSPSPIALLVVSLMSQVQSPFMVIDYEINGHFPPSTDSRRVIVSYKGKYVHKVKLAQEKSVVR